MAYSNASFLTYSIFDSPQYVYLGDNSRLEIKGSGKVKILFSEGTSHILDNVLHIPDLKKNLFSVKQFDLAGGSAVIKNGQCILRDSTNRILTTCFLNGDLYKLGDTAIQSHQSSSIIAATTVFPSIADLWHHRLGHISTARVSQLQSQKMVGGIPQHNPTHISSCRACLHGKQTRKPFKSNIPAYRASSVLELIHTDICGPISPPTHSGCRYFMVLIDDFSRYTIIFLLHYKSEAFTRFTQFVAQVETQHQPRRIQTLRSDNGGEYTSSDFLTFCQSRGISRQFTVPYTPQQNGVSERRNRTLANAVRSMLFHSSLPKSYWGEAIVTANYVQNRLPSKALPPSKTPYEFWFHRKPNLSHLRVFGSIAFAKINDSHTKLDFRTEECIFLGYSDQSKALRLERLRDKTVILSQDAVVLDDQTAHTSLPIPSDSSETDDLVLRSDPMFFRTSSTPHPTAPTLNSSSPSSVGALPPPPILTPSSSMGVLPLPISQSPAEETSSTSLSTPRDGRTHLYYKRRPRISTPSLAQRRSPRIQKAVERFDVLSAAEKDKKQAADKRWILLSSTSSFQEPQSYAEAISGPDASHWKEAITSELQNMARMKAWTLVPLPPNQSTVGCRWVFKIKPTVDGKIHKFKA